MFDKKYDIPSVIWQTWHTILYFITTFNINVGNYDKSEKGINTFFVTYCILWYYSYLRSSCIFDFYNPTCNCTLSLYPKLKDIM